MIWMAIACGALLPVAFVLDEAMMWFGRLALDDRDEDGESAIALSQAARKARLLSRLLVAVAFAGLAALAIRASTSYAMALVVAGAAGWTLGVGALSGVQWGSPLGLAGRAVYRSIQRVGSVLRWVIITWGRLPGPDEPVDALERVKELEQELRWLLGVSGDDGREILANLHEFGESLAEDIMIPREEIVGIPTDMKVSGILEIVEEARHSRYPVFRDSMDTVTGVLHVFDLLDASPDADAQSLAREPLFTNDTKSVGVLLHELQVTYNQMAVVVDEYGGTAGILTVEDVLEELVGEIEDEHGEEEMQLRRLEPGVYWVEGSMRVDELNEALELDLEEGEYDTLAGLVLERLERIPRPGERVRENGVWLEVTDADPHRIQALKVTVMEELA